MTAVKGPSGVITFGASAHGKLTSYDLSSSDTVIDATAFDSTTRELSALGLPTFTLTGEAIFDTADVGQDALRTAIYSGATLAVVVKPEGATTGKMVLTWAAMAIESAKFASATMDGYVTCGFTLKGGEPVETVQA